MYSISHLFVNQDPSLNEVESISIIFRYLITVHAFYNKIVVNIFIIIGYCGNNYLEVPVRLPDTSELCRSRYRHKRTCSLIF